MILPTNPEIALEQARARQQDLLAEAGRRRLLRAAREWRKACRTRARSRDPVEIAGDTAAIAPVRAVPAAVLASTLAACGPRAPGSAR